MSQENDKIFLAEVTASDGWIWSCWCIGHPGEEESISKAVRSIFNSQAANGDLFALEVNVKMTDFKTAGLYLTFIPMREA